MADVDARWLEALTTGTSTFAAFLRSDEPVAAWRDELPLRCLVSSHPFPDLWRWTVPL